MTQQSSRARPYSVTFALVLGWVLAGLAALYSAAFVTASLSLDTAAAGDARFVSGLLSDAILVSEYAVLLIMTHRRRNWARIVLAAFCVHIAVTSGVALWNTSLTSGTLGPPVYAAIRVMLGVAVTAMLLSESSRRYFMPSADVA